MNINSNVAIPKPINTHNDARTAIKDTLKNIGIDLKDDDLSKVSGKDITNAYLAQSMQMSFTQVGIQANLGNKAKLGEFLGTLGKLGNGFENLQNLTPDKAKDLMSEDGYWGVNKTAERIAGFVLNGAGDDIEKLKAGREGIIRGFNQAEKMLGGFAKGYGDIANSTLDNALKAIDDKIAELGGKVLDVKA